MIARLPVVLTLSALGVFGCSCAEDAPACERFPQARVSFVGTVLSGNDDGSGRFNQETLYLVRVEEAFRGLAPEQKEVFIDPGSYTSCYTGYAVGQKYLFYAGGMGNVPRKSFLPDAKPWPTEWEGKRDLKVYMAATCSGSKRVDGAEADLAWIRSALRGRTTTRVYGVAYQHYEFYSNRAGNVPLVEARVFLQGSG